MTEQDTVVVTAEGEVPECIWILEVDGNREYEQMTQSGSILSVPVTEGEHSVRFQIDSPTPFKGTVNVVGKKLSFITDAKTAYEVDFTYDGVRSPFKKKREI